MSMRVKCACGEWVELKEEGETRCGVCGRTADPNAERRAADAPLPGAAPGSGRVRVVIAVLLALTLVLVLVALKKGATKPEGDDLSPDALEAPADIPAEPADSPASKVDQPATETPKGPRKIPTVLRGNDGVTVRKPKDGGPVELVVDPFPEDLKPKKEK